MTLRDWFAGMALQGIWARIRSWSSEEMADAAYKQADLMMARRERGG